MHELSIALSIIELAEEESARRGGAGVHAVHLRLGPLAGVVKEALEASYELARETSTVASSRLLIEEVPLVVFCPNCHAERTLNSMQWFLLSGVQHAHRPDYCAAGNWKSWSLELEE